jgi:hypothetical protein
MWSINARWYRHSSPGSLGHNGYRSSAMGRAFPNTYMIHPAMQVTITDTA